MGLAPYGEPHYADVITQKLIDVKPDGSFRMDMSYFNYCHGLSMTSDKFHRLFGRPPRRAESEIEQLDMDLAASVQLVTEQIMLRCAEHAHQQTGLSNLCLAGGVALNCVGNGRILREGPFDQIWIQPAAGDAGGALGVALLIQYQLLERPREVSGDDLQRGSLLGPRYESADVEATLNELGAVYDQYPSRDQLAQVVAEELAAEKVIGLFQGSMEFGPRSLGCRSIIGDARCTRMQRDMNLKVKFRESFRPFAPSVLRGRVHDFFEMKEGEESPYMLLVAPVRESQRLELKKRFRDLTGLDRRDAVRSKIPAVTHVDYSARVQTIDPERHGIYYDIVKRFESLTDCPVIINTSFNVRGEPIVNTPAEAFACFMATDIDTLVVEDFVLKKARQRVAPRRQQHLDQFALD